MADRKHTLAQHLANIADDRGFVHATNQELADGAGLSLRTTERALAELVKLGFVRRSWRGNMERVLRV